MTTFTFIYSILLAVVSSAPTSDDLLITLPDGQVRGVEYKNENNVTYYGFQGIPFATPPLGDLRFEAPQPPKPWSGILDGSKQSKACMSPPRNHTTYKEEEVSEDCLYINVYTPSLKPAESLPVMFWIYGGAFIGGSSSKTVYGPDWLIEEDVIVVAPNYRVGAFGFLSTGDEALRGNAGLKDQVLALQWTHDNIALFGGDPDKVTIFGESAGGQSTGLQMMSKLSVGLFRAAIVQSGSVLTNSSVVANPEKYTFELASRFPDGDYGNDTQKLKKFLQQKTADEINDAAASITGTDIHAWPTLEEGEGAFITESPYVLLESGNFIQVPIMIGICAEEGLRSYENLVSLQEQALMLDADLKKLIPSDLYLEDSKDEEAAISKIRSLYLQDNETFSTNLVALVKFTTDNQFAIAAIKHAELHSNYLPAYLYQFSYYGRTTLVPVINGTEKASHTAELAFLFNGAAQSASTILSISSAAEDLLTQNRMVKLWTNFAKYLNPTPEESELFTNVIWPTTSPSNLQYLNINNTLEVRQGLKEDVFRGWNETYYTYGKKPFITF